MTEVQAAFCNECGRTSRHTVRAEYRQLDETDNGAFELLHSIMECGGCGMVSFRTRQWYSEMQDYTEDPNYQYTYYPPRIERAEPRWYGVLPDDIQVVLGETHDAFYNEYRVLAAIGIRTVLDLAIVGKIGDVGPFARKIDTLVTRSLITDREANLLKTALDVGSAAAHRGYEPAIDHLRIVVDIMQSILKALYVTELKDGALQRAADEVSRRVPPRSGHRDSQQEGNSG
jgi:hypothetical protein